jgi:preprotein translocase subunit SecE
MNSTVFDSNDFFVHVFVSLPEEDYHCCKSVLDSELKHYNIKYRLNIIQSACEIEDTIKDSISQEGISPRHFFLWFFHANQDSMDFANGEELDWNEFAKIIFSQDYGVDKSNICLCACESLYASFAITPEVESEKVNNFIASPVPISIDEAVINACQFLNDIKAGKKLQESTVPPFRLIRGEDLKTIAQLQATKKPGGKFAAFFIGIGKKFKEVFSELKKVSWPNMPKVIKHTGVVLGVVLAFMIIITLIDFGLGQLLQLLTSIGA